MEKLDAGIIRKAARILKAIAHPKRLEIIENLNRCGHLPVSKLMVNINLDQVMVSKHLSVLKRLGIVRSESEGSFRYYSIANPQVVGVLNCLGKYGRSKARETQKRSSNERSAS